MSLRTITKVSTGGGGGSANVVWGPDFGESSDGNTWTVDVDLDLEAVDLENDKIVGVQVTMPQLSLDYIEKVIGVNVDLDDVALENNKTVGVNLDLEAIDLENNKTVGVRVTMPELALENNKTVGVHLSGEVLGAPFWQSEAHNALTAAGNTLIINKPPGLAVGDLMVAFLGVTGPLALPPSVGILSGWTLIRSSSVTGASNTNRASSFWRVATAADVSGISYTWPFFNNPVNGTGEIHRIIGTDATTPIHKDAEATGVAAGLVPDPVAPAVITTLVNCMVFYFLYHDHAALAQTHTAPSGNIEQTDYESTNVTVKTSATSGQRIFAAAGDTGTATVNCTETVATDFIIQRIAIAPGTLIIAP